MAKLGIEAVCGFNAVNQIAQGAGVYLVWESQWSEQISEMAPTRLFSQQYAQTPDTAVGNVTVTFFNFEWPSVWDEVSAWIDRHGPIANAEF
jgi:hypothetical protein